MYKNDEYFKIRKSCFILTHGLYSTKINHWRNYQGWRGEGDSNNKKCATTSIKEAVLILKTVVTVAFLT